MIPLRNLWTACSTMMRCCFSTMQCLFQKGAVSFYLSNYNGRWDILESLNIWRRVVKWNLYIEIDSRFAERPSGYPNELFDYQQQDNMNIPADYSYAKYYNGRLTLYKGSYNYPISAGKYKTRDGFAVEIRDKCVHFVNRVLSDDNIVVISRPKRSFFPYLVSFSYLMLFYCAVFFIILRLRRARMRAVSKT